MAVRNWSKEDRIFARAIHESPMEDGPRLAYADWLESRGDLVGRYIRLHIAWDEYLHNGCKIRPPGLEGVDLSNIHDLFQEINSKIGEAWDRPRPVWVKPAKPFLYSRGLPYGLVYWPVRSEPLESVKRASARMCPLMTITVWFRDWDRDDVLTLIGSALWRRVHKVIFDVDDISQVRMLADVLCKQPRMHLLSSVGFSGISPMTRRGELIREIFKPLARVVSVIDCRKLEKDPGLIIPREGNS